MSSSPSTTATSQTAKGKTISLDGLMMLAIFVFSAAIFLGLFIDSAPLVYATGAILTVITIAFVLRNLKHPARMAGADENERTRNLLHRIFLLLYVQFCYYWGTLAAGMYTNFYYVIPNSLQPNFGSIFFEVLLAPDLFVHVIMALLSTSMSIPVIYLARTVGLRDVVRLHVIAPLFRVVGFVMGPLFLFYGTTVVNLDASASMASLIMATVFGVAVFLTLLSRVFIVREDVRLKSAAVASQVTRLTMGRGQ